MKHKLSGRILLGLLAVLLTAAGVFLLIRVLAKPVEQRNDYQLISSDEYDSVFLSMYPVDSYHKEDFAYYRAMTLFKASYCIPDFSTLKDYMGRIAKSGNTIATVYLGIRPDKITPEEIQALAALYPSVMFEAILAYPSAEYWQTLETEAYENLLDCYTAFLLAAPEMTGVNFYSFGSWEWLMANPSNYIDEWQLNEDLSRTVMLNSDQEKYPYIITAENNRAAADSLAALTRKMRSNPPVYPDLSGRCILFFGDSVIGNYTDSASIPGVVAGLTGARVYNCGYGGNTAAMNETVPISLPGIIDAFFREDLTVLPREFQVYQGISSYLDNPPGEGQEMCFVINYGLNDYFQGNPVASQDPWDITTYCGALRTAVKSIRTHAPQAQIILCTPTFSPRFESGTMLMSENGGTLQDYAEAVLSLAEELGTDVLDNYYTPGIDAENQEQYLEDQVHPNAAYRYLIGCRLIELIR